jgi:hypothetical protein
MQMEETTKLEPPPRKRTRPSPRVLYKGTRLNNHIDLPFRPPVVIQDRSGPSK